MHKSVDEDPGIESEFITQKGQQSVCLFFLAKKGKECLQTSGTLNTNTKYIKGSASVR